MMAEPQEHPFINATSSPADKIAYMQNLLATLQGLDANHDGRISTAELANDDVRKYLDYRRRIDLPGKNPDPLRELRDDLQGALKGDATAQANVIETLQSINAQDPQNLRNALNVAAALDRQPRDAGAATAAAERGQFERGLRNQLNQLTEQQRHAPGTEQAIGQAYDTMQKAKAQGMQTAYDTMVAAMGKNATPEALAELRTSLGMPPARPEVDRSSHQQQEIVELGRQLAQFSPAHIEAAPTVPQLAAAVNAPPVKGNGR